MVKNLIRLGNQRISFMRYLVFIFIFGFSGFAVAQQKNGVIVEEEKAVEEVKVVEEDKGDLDELFRRGELLFEEQKISEAEKIYEKIKTILSKNPDSTDNIRLLIDVANLRYHQDNVIATINNLQQALNIAKKLKDGKKLGYLYSRLSYLYYQDDPKLAKSYIESAIEYNVEQKKYAEVAENYYNLMIINRKLGLPDDSEEAREEYLAHKKHLKNDDFFKLSEVADDDKHRYDVQIPEGSNLIVAEHVNIQILNKINGFTYVYEMRVGSEMEISNIKIITRSCFKSAPEDLPENMALLEVNEIDKEEESESVFNGWIFSSAPSLNSLEHPIYDIRLLNCRVKNI